MIRDLQKISQSAAAVAVAKSALKEALQNQRALLEALNNSAAFREQVQQIATKHGVEVVRYAVRLSEDSYVSVETGAPLNTLTVIVSGPEGARLHFTEFTGDLWKRLVGDGATRVLFDDRSLAIHYIAVEPPAPEPEPVVVEVAEAIDAPTQPVPEEELSDEEFRDLMAKNHEADDESDEPIAIVDEPEEKSESWEKPEELPPSDPVTDKDTE